MTSVYVEFPLDDGFLIVWTTTPWTLPANLAVAVNPKVDYARVKYRRAGKERIGFVAADLAERVFKDRPGVESFEVVGTKKGIELLNGEYRHPFIDNQSGKSWRPTM